MTIQSILDYLNQFTTPDQLRAECVRLGVKGVPRHCECCVVAEMLKVETWSPVSINPNQIAECSYVILGTESRPLPAHVNAFALAFDRGEYPELVQSTDAGQ